MLSKTKSNVLNVFILLNSQQDAEALRCKLKVKSRLVVAGGADELLRLPRLKRHLEGVTQRMLECAIVVSSTFIFPSVFFFNYI